MTEQHTHRTHRLGARGATLTALMAAAALAWGGATAQAAPAAGGHRAAATAGTISTVAGGVGGPGQATKVAVGAPWGVTFAGGHLYISQGYVRAVSEATGQLTTPAGAFDSAAPAGDGALAAQANLDAFGTAVDPAGNLVIADRSHNRVRAVAAKTGSYYGQPMTAKDIYTVAGDGTAGFSGDGGPATQAELSDPEAVTIDGHGNLVIADTGNNRIRVVAASTGSFYGQPMTAGHIYTVAGDGTAGLSGNGGPAVSAAITGPADVTVDAAGNLVLTDQTFNGQARVVAVTSGTFYGKAMTAGHIYRVAGGGNDGVTNGIPADQALLASPGGLTTDSAGNLVIAVDEFGDVRVVPVSTGTFYGQQMTAGHIYTIAGAPGSSGLGDGGPATSAALREPEGVAFDSAGNLLISDYFDNRVRAVAASSGTFYGQPMTAGDIYTVAGDGNQVSGTGGPAAEAEIDPAGVTADHAGNLVVTDTSAFGLVRVVAERSGIFYGQPMTAGKIYTVAGGGESEPGNGGPATGARLLSPQGVTVDGHGNLLITEGFGGNLVRVIAASSGSFYGQPMTAGDIYTVAGDGLRFFKGDGGPATSAQLNSPASVALDAAGNLVITDTPNNRVRVVAETTGTRYGQAMTAGDIYTVAGDGRVKFNGNGKPATQAGINEPQGVTVDGHGNLLITDAGNNRVRVVAESTGTFYGQAMTAGDIYTIAGDGTAGFSGDGGPARKAETSAPAGIAIDEAGNLLVTDAGNNRVRVIAESTGSFYGQPMTAGNIYTIAGGGAGGLGDGGPATSAELSDPLGLAVRGDGSLVIADLGDVRVRTVSG